MGTNAYKSDQVVHFGDDHKVTYYGFCISWDAGDYTSFFPFQTDELRERFVKAVADLRGSFELAAVLACGEMADSPSERDAARDYAFSTWSDGFNAREWEAITELAEEWGDGEGPERDAIDRDDEARAVAMDAAAERQGDAIREGDVPRRGADSLLRECSICRGVHGPEKVHPCE